MRLLSLNIQDSLINYLESNNIYICDVAEDFSDAKYHCKVRFYNLILIHTLSDKNIVELLKDIDPLHSAVIIISSELSKKKKIELYKTGALQVLEDYNNEILLARIKSIHKENFIEKYNYSKLLKLYPFVKNVFDVEDKKLNIKGKSFEILNYLIKNKNKSVVSKEEIVYALWEEPELICNNVVEVNINQIRKETKKKFKFDIISTIRNRGYKITEIKDIESL